MFILIHHSLTYLYEGTKERIFLKFDSMFFKELTRIKNKIKKHKTFRRNIVKINQYKLTFPKQVQVIKIFQ